MYGRYRVVLEQTGRAVRGRVVEVSIGAQAHGLPIRMLRPPPCVHGPPMHMVRSPLCVLRPPVRMLRPPVCIFARFGRV